MVEKEGTGCSKNVPCCSLQQHMDVEQQDSQFVEDLHSGPCHDGQEDNNKTTILSTPL